MSEKILRALMQLFAIVSNVGEDKENSRAFVRAFLKQQLSQDLVNKYLIVYDDYFGEQNQKRKGLQARKRTSLNSVRILKICNEINKELTQKRKVLVLVRLLEYIYQIEKIDQQTLEFVETVSDSFNIEREEYHKFFDFVFKGEGELKSDEFLMVVDGENNSSENQVIKLEGFQGEIRVLYNPTVQIIFMEYFGNEELQLNGQMLTPQKIYVLTQGTTIRGAKVHPIYYSDLIKGFIFGSSEEQISFDAENISYKFNKQTIGLHPMSLHEKSGRLIGIMGASGSGKSTLLNVLNGTYKPSSGAVKINGIAIHDEDNRDAIEGSIGYVPQSDYLIEELTVFENVYYNAKLSFGNLPDKKIIRLVLNILSKLELDIVKDLKVGSPLQKTISGGQRKRVNIALELIREPSILFVDEPTSGLSSRDSENIMTLLKELTLHGKLIFVVIHQPSSEIYKMFDKLVILDTGGYMIFYGNPIDAVIYFKKKVQHVGSSECECPLCSNVNPEQIFDIIETKVLDEFGRPTETRKTKSKEWYLLFKDKFSQDKTIVSKRSTSLESKYKKANRWKQFRVYTRRDILSKIANKQYLLINFLEAPVLGLLLSYFIKYSNPDEAQNSAYIFRENENIIAYIFMSVIVALFMGLTVSAEEIIRDRKILERERFLNLSRGSYLFSKISIMFVVSAIQTLTFVLVGNSILEIKGMYGDYWLVLFSIACFGNLLGLNISAAFNSAVTIYILIPFLIIPQLILGGVIVKFEKLNPTITTQDYVPLTGEIMASRWAFEALSVNQFKNNEFEKHFYHYDKHIKIASYRKNFWLERLEQKLNFIKRNQVDDQIDAEVKKAIDLLKYEIGRENDRNPSVKFESITVLAYPLSEFEIEKLSNYFQELRGYYIHVQTKAMDLKDSKILKMTDTEEKRKEFNQLRDTYSNQALTDMMTGRDDYEKIIETENHLIQRAYPIYRESAGFRAHFLAPSKMFLGLQLTTFSANVAVLWTFILILCMTLYFNLLRKALKMMSKFGSK